MSEESLEAQEPAPAPTPPSLESEEERNSAGTANAVGALIRIMKPFKLILPASSALIAVFMGFHLANPNEALPLFYFNWPSSYPFIKFREGYFVLLEAITSLMLIFAASHAINDVYDSEIDAVNRPHRPIPSKVLTRNDAYSLALILYLVGLFRSTFVNQAFSVFALLIVLLTLLYSVPPVRLKKRFILNNLSIGLSYGLLVFVAGWSVFGNVLDLTPWILGLFLVLFLLGAATTKDFHDLPGDREHGARTLPVVLGVRGAFAVVVVAFLLPYPLILLFMWLGLLKAESYLLLSLVAWSLFCIIYLRKPIRRLDEVRERPHYSTWFYTHSLTLMLVLGFFVVYVWI